MPSRKKRSPRLEIRILDNQIGRYPTVARTGDSNRSGAGSIFYDDTDTFVYTQLSDSASIGPQFVSLPTSLPSGSKYLLGNLTSSIFVSGNAIRDVEQWLNPVVTRQFESIRPYIESKQYEQDLKTTSFYQTGSSLTEFGTGFISNLGSKTKISIEIPVTTAVQMQPSSASIYYLNGERGRFEEIASNIRHRPYPNINFWETRLFSPLGSNILSSAVNNVLQLGHIPNSPGEAVSQGYSYLREGPIGGTTVFDNLGRLLQLSISQSALVDSNFEATSSQTIQMNRYISQPFLVEKVVMEIPIKAGPDWLQDYTRFVRINAINGYRNDPFDAGGPAVTFGLINQINRNNRELILSATIIPVGDNFASASRVATYSERFATGFLSYGKPASVIPSASNSTFTGSIKLNLEPRISNGITSLGFACAPGSYPSNDGRSFRNSFAIAVNPFGRGMRGTSAGRSAFGKEFASPDEDPIASLIQNFPPVTGCDVFLFNYEKGAISPYILFPQDKLLLSVSKYRACISHSIDQVLPAAYDFNLPMPLNRNHDIWMDSGTVKITMYGSMIREGSEYHDTLNSRLDTNAVHESIHNVVVDDWDIGSKQEFSGSMSAQFMSGTIASFLNRLEYQWSRQQQIDSTNFDPKNTFTSIFNSQQTVQYWENVQFFRNTQLISENEQYYDSMIPRFDQILTIENSLAPYNIGIGDSMMLITIDAVSDVVFGYTCIDWSRSFPFEPKYSNLNRTKLIDKISSNINEALYISNPLLPVLPPLQSTDERIALETFDGNDWQFIGADFKSGRFIGLRYVDLIKQLYGIGDRNNVRRGSSWNYPYESDDQFYGSTCHPMYRNTVLGKPLGSGMPGFTYDITRVGTILRGWKYGILNGFETQTKSIFRRNRYGHLRDMLEQRLDSKFHDGSNTLSAPINIKFIGPNGLTVKPENTFSSNLSFEATSSLPYFDGIVRNREEPLYIPSIYSMRFTR